MHDINFINKLTQRKIDMRPRRTRRIKRMTLTGHKLYSTDDVRKFMGLGPNTNISYRDYPELAYCDGYMNKKGYYGQSIINAIKARNPHRHNTTYIVSEYYTDNGSKRAELGVLA